MHEEKKEGQLYSDAEKIKICERLCAKMAGMIDFEDLEETAAPTFHIEGEGEDGEAVVMGEWHLCGIAMTVVNRTVYLGEREDGLIEDLEQDAGVGMCELLERIGRGDWPLADEDLSEAFGLQTKD